ncbi:helix-turn-helix domain-containing protein [Flavivirga eckloniae]|uniref:AraC family transcriptional regulator n=1 Tax=Flavivirga eckloniae TaxID=1803846 RepID=A0A2K9PS37_9FLAO|nr:AraC family transcriptional regulator [Flavivirga eckloniae]AUP79875.1 AraC family transcriptional regulator [Flavivirga eckloniae]
MIIDYKRLDLFGKMLFETMVLKPPFQKDNIMQNEACFLHIIEGTYNSTSEKEQIQVNSKESILMKCGNYLSDMIPTPNTEKYQAIAVHFFPEVLSRIYENKLPEFLKKKTSPSIGMAKIHNDKVIEKYIDSLLFYFENPQVVDEEILILKLKEIILLLSKTKNAPEIKIILSNLFEPNSYTLRDIVDAHLYSSITIERLASLAGMSVSTFKRQFKKAYQESPATYLRTKKIEKALELLSKTELRATEIAYECGFSSVAHFSRIFKEQHGMSPTTYKLNHFGKSLD